ncbi:MAG TPA: DNA-formamidopyrimidine glycosylase family protein [Acidimicrobiales bacterium]|nr:DNA-formamidopyrimidine glycosylase family protein [Acidimicrobiales bacterium]
MPELVEVEVYRAGAAGALYRPISGIKAFDAWYLKRGLLAGDLDALVGLHFTAAQRHGKLLVMHTSSSGRRAGPVLGLRFGMSGRLVVDGVSGVNDLRYAQSVRTDGRYVRFEVRFEDGGTLAVHDPRRLGGVEMEPDLRALGPDAASITTAPLRGALGTSAVPLKVRLMDQSRLAGVGNLIADEVLWCAGLSPLRAAGALDPEEVEVLAGQLRRVVGELSRRGGSHLGDLAGQRRPGGSCPRDGSPLERSRIGGRTTWWCPVHQR